MRSSRPLTSARTARARRTASALVRGREAGFALPSAIIILFVVTMLTSAAIVVATQSSTSTTRDNNVKAEVEAAEAGLHVASYRLNQLLPSSVQCIAEAAISTELTQCKDSPEPLGNGATFQYWTTLPLKVGESCAGRTVQAIEAGTIVRCVTSEGVVNGVKPGVRLQTQVKASTLAPLFPVNGLVGLESVVVAPNAIVKAKGATNGTFKIENNASVEGVTLGVSAPAGQPEVGAGASSGPVTRESKNFTLAPVNTGNSATENSNFRIENGLTKPKTAPYDAGSKVEYSKETRTLEVGINGELTLGGETYNFCNFVMNNNTTVNIAEGAKVKIYIDSPNDPGSKCIAGDGKFRMSTNSNFVNPSKDPTALQIYVYDNSGGTVEFSNNIVFYGVIYAPNSTVSVKNNAEIFGAVAGKVTELKNNATFNADKRVENIQITTPPTYRRALWEQCTVGSGATEGC
jgi:hypothetical protein